MHLSISGLRHFLTSSTPVNHSVRFLASPLSLAPKANKVKVENEPVLTYLAGSQELRELESALNDLKGQCVEVPIVINGKEYRSNIVQEQPSPFDHRKKVARFHWATPELISKAIEETRSVRTEWELTPITERIRLFLQAADLVSGKYRMKLNAATMLGQAKTVIQAEIDAAAELADFFRFNAMFASELLQYQPISTNPAETINTFRYRSLEGFVAAVSPFNFTAIGGNLASAPALMGNVVLWKPSDTAILSNYIIFKLLEEAGFPPGVINFLPSDGPVFGDTIVNSEHLSGINFTGSVPTFRRLWKQTANNLERYKTFPRLVGECGGKNFHLVHSSAHVDTVVASTIRSSFEFGGQKCSACSRMYVPKSLWPKIKEGLLETRKHLKLGSPLEYDTFLSAVIDEKAFDRIAGYIKHAKNSSSLEVLGGGGADKSTGFMIEPTIVESKDPKDRIMTEEIFGPLLSVFVYDDNQFDQVLDLVDSSTPYALTGAIFCQDQEILKSSVDRLINSAGNFYINDKSTGSVVGQQPFGGSRLSGTNDKAGGPHYMLKWASAQNVKETFVPLTDYKYPYMESRKK